MTAEASPQALGQVPRVIQALVSFQANGTTFRAPPSPDAELYITPDVGTTYEESTG